MFRFLGIIVELMELLLMGSRDTVNLGRQVVGDKGLTRLSAQTFDIIDMSMEVELKKAELKAKRATQDLLAETEEFEKTSHTVGEEDEKA